MRIPLGKCEINPEIIEFLEDWPLRDLPQFDYNEWQRKQLLKRKIKKPSQFTKTLRALRALDIEAAFRN